MKPIRYYDLGRRQTQALRLFTDKHDSWVCTGWPNTMRELARMDLVERLPGRKSGWRITKLGRAVLLEMIASDLREEFAEQRKAA